MANVSVSWAVLAAAGSLAAGLLSWGLWWAGQQSADAARSAGQPGVTRIPSGWWMGAALAVPGGAALVALHLVGREDLALGQLIGGDIFRVLGVVAVLAAAGGVGAELSATRWLLLAALLTPLLVMLAGLAGEIGPVDGQLLATATVILAWVSVRDEAAPAEALPRRPVAAGAGRPWGVLAWLAGSGAMAAGVGGAIALVRCLPAGWYDRPVGVTVVAVGTAWSALPVALHMRRCWGGEAALRGLLAANVLSLGLALGVVAVFRPVGFPLLLWRIDGWLMLLVAVAPLPLLVGAGRFGRWEAAGLLGFYGLYLAGTWSLTL